MITKGMKVKFTEETLNTYKTGVIADIIKETMKEPMIATDIETFDNDVRVQINNNRWFQAIDLEIA